MALSNKEKQQQYRDRMRANGYRPVQVWVKDAEQARLILAMKALESGSKLPYHGLRWECERVVLEFHKISVDIASRERKVFQFFNKLLADIYDAGKDKCIPYYLFLDIVELLRPVIGDELYRGFKVGKPRAKRYSKVFKALFGQDEDKFMEELLGHSEEVLMHSGFDDLDVDF